jgi:hypothetical protein
MPENDMVRLFKGDYLFRGEYPHVLLTVERLERDPGHGAMVHQIIQRLPEGGFTLESTAIKDATTAQTYQDMGVNDIPAFLAEEGTEWARRKLELRKTTAAEETKISAAWSEYELTESKDWKKDLLRLRLNGLPDAIIENIIKLTRTEALLTELRRVLHERPIVAKPVK